MLALVMSLATPPAVAAPQLSVPQPRRDLGPLTAGDTAEAEFAFANTGDLPLAITHVAVSCGCTTTSYPPSLRPGEKGALKVKLASSALWSGIVEKQITIHSNDPAQPEMKLDLVADMRPLFRFDPPNPLSINYRKGDVLRQIVSITAAADATVAVTGATPAGSGTEARLLPRQSCDPPGVARVEVTVRPPAQGGDFSTSVILQTSHVRVPTVPLVLMAVSQDAITVSPSFLYLGSLRAPTKSGEERLLILFKRSGAFRVLAVRTGTPVLQAALRPPAKAGDEAANSYHEISIRYLGGSPPGDVTGTIVVSTDDPDSRTLEVPFQARVE